MKTLNFILNQLGFIALVVILVLLYQGAIELNLYSSVIIVALFSVIFVSSQLVWKGLQRDKLNKWPQD